MVTVVVVLVGVILLVALVLAAVYLIQPEDFKISAVLLKLITFSIEIKNPRSR